MEILTNIMFVPDICGGCAPDQFTWKDGLFYDLLEPGDEVLAERAFEVKQNDIFH